MQISIEGVDGVINALQNLVSGGKLQNALFDVTLVVIHKYVIYVYHITGKINVIPPQADNFTHTHTCSEHYDKYRIPMVMSVGLTRCKPRQRELRLARGVHYFYLKIHSFF